MTDPKGMTDEQWRGYVTAKLEDICDAVAEIETGISELRNRYFGMRVKIATLSGTIALIVTGLTMLIGKHL